jgi:hypothetical protein
MPRPRGAAALALVLLFLLLAPALTGCFRVTYQSGRPRGPVKVRHTHGFFLLGLVGEMHVRPEADCQGKGVARMASGVTAVDALLTIVTVGIYAPRTVVVTCAP